MSATKGKVQIQGGINGYKSPNTRSGCVVIQLATIAWRDANIASNRQMSATPDGLIWI